MLASEANTGTSTLVILGSWGSIMDGETFDQSG